MTKNLKLDSILLVIKACIYGETIPLIIQSHFEFQIYCVHLRNIIRKSACLKVIFNNKYLRVWNKGHILIISIICFTCVWHICKKTKCGVFFQQHWSAKKAQAWVRCTRAQSTRVRFEIFIVRKLTKFKSLTGLFGRVSFFVLVTSAYKFCFVWVSSGLCNLSNLSIEAFINCLTTEIKSFNGNALTSAWPIMISFITESM